MKKKLILPLAAILMVCVAQMSVAQPGCGYSRVQAEGYGSGPGPGFGHGRGERILEMAEDLKLTPEQVAKIKAMHLSTAKETIEIRNQIELKQLELQELLSADRPDIRTVEAKIDEIVPLRATLQKKHIGQRLAVRNILTPEQRTRHDAMRGPEMRHERGQRRGWDDEEEDEDDRGPRRR